MPFAAICFVVAQLLVATPERAALTGAQLMSTCAEGSPERKGETGCSIIGSKLLPATLRQPVFWHIDRFDSLARAQAAVGPAAIAFDAAGTAWLMTIGPASSDHHGGTHVAQVGPLPLPHASRYSMVVQSAVFTPGMYSLVHHHSGVEAVYVVEGKACYETPDRAFMLSKGETVVVPANTPMRAVVPATTARRYVLAVIVHDASQPATMRMEEGDPQRLAACK